MTQRFYLGPLQQKITETLEKHSKGLRPKQLTIMTGASSTSVSYALNALVSKGVINRTVGKRAKGENGKEPVIYKLKEEMT